MFVSPGSRAQRKRKAAGGAGTVTSVTASVPLVSSGGTTPNLTLNTIGPGLAVVGGNLTAQECVQRSWFGV